MSVTANMLDMTSQALMALTHKLDSLAVQIAEDQQLIADLSTALKRAKDVIETDREALFACHMNPVTKEVDDDLGLAGLAIYDGALAAIEQVESRL